MTKPWHGYEITKAHDLDDQTGGAQSFSVLYHVAHASDARRVLEDGAFLPALVQDESRLRKTRIAVVWTSPNTWYNGSLYGHVSFELSTANFLDDHFIYWVEDIKPENRDGSIKQNRKTGTVLSTLEV